MYAQSEWKAQPETLRVAIMVAFSLFVLAACDADNQPNRASTNTGQSSSGSIIQSALPTPLGTPGQADFNAQATQMAQRLAATPAPLVNASPEEIGQLAVKFARNHGTIRSGEPQVLLTRPVTLHELTALGLGEHDVESIEEPPLMLVILKGDFSPFPKPGAGEGFPSGQGTTQPDASRIAYVAYVYDLWRGIPMIIQESKDGGIFKKVLNDPTLPDVPPLSSLNDAKNRMWQPNGPKVMHYGDTGIGGEPISGQVIRKASFGAWSYIAKLGVVNVPDTDNTPVSPGQIYVRVDHDWNSATGAQDYINANKKMLPQIAAQSGLVEVSIVFNTYIPTAQFLTFAQSHKLKVLSSYLRAIDQTAKPVYAPYYTLHIKASETDPLPQAIIDSKLSAANNSPQKQVSLKGVYCSHVLVDAKELTAIAAEPSVYYVDVTAEAARNDLAQAGIANARGAAVVNYAYVLFSLVEQRYQPK
ncbi:MAG: hypothetical protein DLM69_06295 [Candidatus Chloroheliales bacterium]|nr:MAG: hypothetical protein DLM69_06295 [Chloroflexota bacterium]